MALINRDWRSYVGLFESASATPSRWNKSHNETSARTVSPGIFPWGTSAAEADPPVPPDAAFFTVFLELMELIAALVQEGTAAAHDWPCGEHRPAMAAGSNPACGAYADRTANMWLTACAVCTAGTTYMLPVFQGHSTL